MHHSTNPHTRRQPLLLAAITTIGLSLYIVSSMSYSHTQNSKGEVLDAHIATAHAVGSHADYAHFDKPLVCPDGELTTGEEAQYDLLLPTAKDISLEREKLAKLITDKGLTDLGRVPAAPAVRDSLYELGQLLAFDKVLSGNRNISCMSCHHPNTFTGDERMLGFGTGGKSTPEALERGRIALGFKKAQSDSLADSLLRIGTERTGNLETVIARHTPPTYNLHVYDSLFWDGRIEYKAVNAIPEGAFYAEDSQGIKRLVSRVTVAEQTLTIFNEYRSGGTLVVPKWADGTLVDSDPEAGSNEQRFEGEIKQVPNNATWYVVNTPDNSAVASVANNFEFGIVSALPLFPLTSHVEMIGANESAYTYPQDGSCPSSTDNGIAAKTEQAAGSLTATWSAVIERLRCEAPAYLAYFKNAYNNVDDWNDIDAGHLSNAIAAYMIREFEARQTPWQEFLDDVEAKVAFNSIDAMTRGQVLGAQRFIEVGCVSCHSGAAFSNFDFHNTGLPQVGPGKLDDDKGMLTMATPDDDNAPNKGGNHFTGDLGRQHHDALAAPFSFKTSTLINVAETWTRGHGGQFLKLNDFVEHYRDPVTSYVNYQQCFSGPVEGQVPDADAVAVFQESDKYGFAAQGTGGEVLKMLWDSEDNATPHDDSIIMTLDPKVIALTQGQDSSKMTRFDVKAISQFLGALTSKEVCDNAWPARQGNSSLRDLTNDPSNKNDPYYRYQQAAVSPPIVKRINSIDNSDDGMTVLFNRNGVKDIPRLVEVNGSYDYIDLSHKISGLPIDWFYREPCAADSDQ